jgi:hypothetical protein
MLTTSQSVSSLFRLWLADLQPWMSRKWILDIRQLNELVVVFVELEPKCCAHALCFGESPSFSQLSVSKLPNLSSASVQCALWPPCQSTSQQLERVPSLQWPSSQLTMFNIVELVLSGIHRSVIVSEGRPKLGERVVCECCEFKSNELTSPPQPHASLCAVKDRIDRETKRRPTTAGLIYFCRCLRLPFTHSDTAAYWFRVLHGHLQLNTPPLLNWKQH